MAGTIPATVPERRRRSVLHSGVGWAGEGAAECNVTVAGLADFADVEGHGAGEVSQGAAGPYDLPGSVLSRRD